MSLAGHGKAPPLNDYPHLDAKNQQCSLEGNDPKNQESIEVGGISNEFQKCIKTPRHKKKK